MPNRFENNSPSINKTLLISGEPYLSLPLFEGVFQTAGLFA
jgi:hypothetical protein